MRREQLKLLLPCHSQRNSDYRSIERASCLASGAAAITTLTIATLAILQLRHIAQ